MTGFSVDFLGCKVSQADAEAIRDALRAAGHDEDAVARVRVVNTCCITAEAEKKSRKKVRQLASAADAEHVFVTGCGATLRPEVYAELGPQVTPLPGAAALAAASIVRHADQLADLGCKGPAPGRAPAQRRGRAFVKVQDGCNFHCSYCIVPTVRGDTTSRPIDTVLDDVRRRVARGQREIVLTGINLGLYREPAARSRLPRLVTAVADVEGVARVRISSIEVNHVDRWLVRALAEHPRVCPHLHVPLQSGDDGVLRDMGRHYDSTRYLRAIDRAREAVPELNLTTDVIVGYPTEDDAAFARTLDVASRAGFTKVHAFPFSPRPGTDAEAGADPVPRSVKQVRSLELREAADARAREHWCSLVGTQDEVVVEHRRGSATLTGGHVAAVGGVADDMAAGARVLAGYTRDYSPVWLEGAADNGDLVAVDVIGVREDGLVARVREVLATAPAAPPAHS